MTPPLGKIIFTRNLTSEKHNKIIISAYALNVLT